MFYDSQKVCSDFDRDGVVTLRRLYTREEVALLRVELERYILDDLPFKPADARTLEPDGRSVRNLWRLERYHPAFCSKLARPDLLGLVSQLVQGEPDLVAVETFNKPARVGSGVPYHQDNAYFCQTPPHMLTVWIALDAVTQENGPVYYIKGSHTNGVLPTLPTGVKGNSIGLAHPPVIPLDEQFCGVLQPGDALIHHCQTVHHSAANASDKPRMGLLLVYRGRHTQTDPKLKQIYSHALQLAPPA